MGIPISAEKRMLASNEFEIVERTHYPNICGLSKKELSDVLRVLRDYRSKARDRAQQQRREMRGKAEPRGIAPASDNSGTETKRKIFTGALKRVNRELARIEKAETDEGQSDIAKRALELKRQNRVRHHPSSDRTANGSMKMVENQKAPATLDPREIGRASQSVKDSQARRDSD
ncbi:hypothetical protein [Skermanella stibiiresistens]|uniref:hypothetical protein n=1 Tax=Skermanella stibiiresistens TaxID=913326 RepID=UPI0005614D19|nr:hypothetical protein [Skermanella stibiiresistens]